MQTTTAAQHMTKSLVTISFDRSVEEAYRLMEQWGVRHLPVSDREGHLVGILADADLFRAMHPERPGFVEDQTVGDYMSWPALTINEQTPIAQVTEAMLTERVSAFLVVNDDGETTGILTSEDLLRLLQRTLSEARPPERAGTLRSLPYEPVVREAMREPESAGL